MNQNWQDAAIVRRFRRPTTPFKSVRSLHKVISLIGMAHRVLPSCVSSDIVENLEELFAIYADSFQVVQVISNTFHQLVEDVLCKSREMKKGQHEFVVQECSGTDVRGIYLTMIFPSNLQMCTALPRKYLARTVKREVVVDIQ